jgi:hypothetical protein
MYSSPTHHHLNTSHRPHNTPGSTFQPPNTSLTSARQTIELRPSARQFRTRRQRRSPHRVGVRRKSARQKRGRRSALRDPSKYAVSLMRRTEMKHDKYIQASGVSDRQVRRCRGAEMGLLVVITSGDGDMSHRSRNGPGDDGICRQSREGGVCTSKF